MGQITQKELIRQFIEENIQNGNAGNGHVRDNQYIHYWTPILERYGDKFIFNQTRYSIVTGQIQKRMKNMIPSDQLIIVGKVPENYSGRLSDFIEE